MDYFKKTSFVIIITLIFSVVNQLYAKSIDDILKSEIQHIDKIAVKPQHNISHIQCNYGQANFQNTPELKKLNGKLIERIDLIYTQNKTSDSFDQNSLNRRRLNNLKKSIPKVFENDLVEWNLIAQTGCSSNKKGGEFYHGFKITFRPAPTKETIETEISLITSSLYGVSDVLSSKTDIVELETTESIVSDEYMTKTPSLWGATHMSPKLTDSTILNVLGRNKDWKNMAIVCDVTGSMYPYTTQLIAWFNLNERTNTNQVKQVTFFNDGNKKTTTEKRIGTTGGIFHTQNTSFKNIEQTAFKTMRAGGGGDLPENNIEAIIKATKKCNDCDSLIMIADNYATPRDLSLISELNQPIKIILCGTSGGINPDYLNLARRTKSSVHTMDSDLTELAILNEGETITIDGSTFKIRKGRFIRSN